MDNQNDNGPGVDRDVIVDRIYRVALEPSALDDFIEFWHDTDMPAHFLENGTENADGAGNAYKSHLERAQGIMQLGESARMDPAEYLRPYNNLAAFVVGGSQRVEASNPGAQERFGAKIGTTLDQLTLPQELLSALIRTFREIRQMPDGSEKILKTETASKGSAILFRVIPIAGDPDDGTLALVVSTHFNWRQAIGTLLGAVYQLTQAEQDIVRMLVEGLDIKSIASERATSAGTVRAQLKSITAKMNLRSQTDIVRFAMALGEFPKGDAAEKENVVLATPKLSGDWLESEVWKPFRTLSLPDGRQMTYHDMGPPMGNPVVLSHMGSCMVRWPRSMLRLAFEQNLRVICPIRAGYGHSEGLPTVSDPVETASEDTAYLLDRLGIERLPYVAQGTDFPFAVDLVSRRPGLISEVLGIGARPCFPGGSQVNGAGRWQRFFVSTARQAPHLLHFASKAVMAMSKRIGPEAMLRQLCKDFPADLALLENDEVRQVLVANISLMAGKSTNAARAFAMEYIAFQTDWSDLVMATRHMNVRLMLAEEDPTIDLETIPAFQDAYPWIVFDVIEQAGLALTFQHPGRLIPVMAEAAKRAA